VAEQVRAGIQSRPRGQTNAGLAMGFTLPQVYQFVLLPMAYRMIIPPMTSEFLTIFKNSSTALTIGVLELTAQSRQISEYTFKTFEAFTLPPYLHRDHAHRDLQHALARAASPSRATSRNPPEATSVDFDWASSPRTSRCCGTA
jgi:hypothetical protein